jgi:hypothetical protein
VSLAANPRTSPDWDRLQRGMLIAGAAGLIVCALAFALGYVPFVAHNLFSPGQIFRSYLVAYIFWLGIGLGSLVILMLQHLTGGVWGLVIRRVLESGSRTLLLLAVLFMPIFLGMHSLYEWTKWGPATDPNERFKHIWLSVPFFVVRTVIYFAIWLVVALFLNRWSAEQDQGQAPTESRRFRLLSAPGIALYGATITFASIDWVMSIEPHWWSTIYPVQFAVGQMLTALAFAIAVLIWLAGRPPVSEVIGPRHLRDLGNLLLAFVMLWAYMSFSQFLLIWSNNLPEEIPWYLRRTRGGWEWLAVLLIVCHFALPFVLLLFRDVKQHGRILIGVAVGILVMHFLDVFWWIEPAYVREGQYLFWLVDIAALVGVGGIWCWWFLWQLRQRPLLPVHDPYWPEVMHHE